MIIVYLQVQFAATHILLLNEHEVRNVGVVSSNPQSISSFEHVLGGPQGPHVSSHRLLHSWVISSDIATAMKTIFVKIASVKTFLNIVCNYPTI